MKPFGGILLALAIFSACPAKAITSFQHIIIIVQENRTPDNLFYALCTGYVIAVSDTEVDFAQGDTCTNQIAPGGSGSVTLAGAALLLTASA